MVLHDKVEIDLEVDFDLFHEFFEGKKNQLLLNSSPIL